MKHDFVGNELKVGDKVVFMQVKYRSLMIGVIKSLADKSALIEHEKTNLCTTESRQSYSQIMLLIK